MRPLVPLALFALLLAPSLPPTLAEAQGVAASQGMRIAIIDTGIDAAHPEFASNQVVAWADFVNGRANPYDDHGHGTATASLAAGLNKGSCGGTPKISYAPGASLLVAKVMDASGSGTFSAVEAGIRWAHHQKADVISISIGGGLPLVGGPLPFRLSEAIGAARAAGILVVVAAGNGFANAGVAPYPAWSSPLGNELDALVVGGGQRRATLTSTTGNTDPDVTAWSDDVCVARPGGGYATGSGTSLSTPLVAGMAATAKATALANGHGIDPNRLEALLVYSSSNSPFSPYAREGLGQLTDAAWTNVLNHATAGTPTSTLIALYDAQGPHARADRVYHDVVDTLRAWQL